MNTQKLRNMNLHVVADELDQLRALRDEVENQEPVGYARPHQLEALLSGKVCGITMEDKPDAHNHVTVPLYAKPVPADKPFRITEQDVREILDTYWHSTDESGDWLKSEECLSLLNKLNAERQAPAGAVAIALQKLRTEVTEALNILAMCGKQIPVNQLGNKLAAALNASDPIRIQ